MLAVTSRTVGLLTVAAAAGFVTRSTSTTAATGLVGVVATVGRLLFIAARAPGLKKPRRVLEYTAQIIELGRVGRGPGAGGAALPTSRRLQQAGRKVGHAGLGGLQEDMIGAGLDELAPGGGLAPGCLEGGGGVGGRAGGHRGRCGHHHAAASGHHRRDHDRRSHPPAAGQLLE